MQSGGSRILLYVQLRKAITVTSSELPDVESCYALPVLQKLQTLGHYDCEGAGRGRYVNTNI